MGALLNEPGLLQGYFVGDLNPDAVDLLSLNIEYLASRRKDKRGNPAAPLHPTELHCRDALDWIHDTNNLNQTDLLLVNLPHHSIEHIEALLPLLKRNQTSVLRGWAIVERAEREESEEAIHRAISSANGTVEQFTFKEVKGFSTTKSFMCFEAWINLSA
jgi:tRNA G37 N-methylase Trm5